MSPPRSPTLMPPMRTTQVNDPGAHELESSDADDDEFADAQEEAPISPDSSFCHDVRNNSVSTAVPAEHDIPIPITVVEKVDPASPSHGDVPGTKAYAKRAVDAVPDVVRSPDDSCPQTGTSITGTEDLSDEVPITVITKVDSEPSYGEVPGTEAFYQRGADAAPDIVEDAQLKPSELDNRSATIPSPSRQVAEDGGFGYISSSESEDIEPGSARTIDLPPAISTDESEEFGDDFDDFEAGADDEDFGTFEDEEISAQEMKSPDVSSASIPQPLPHIPFPVLDYQEHDSLNEIIDACKPYLDSIYSATDDMRSDAKAESHSLPATFFSDRSGSLWTQLVAPPPLQPPSWVRSRIRRLFLVSLGVPVDLDEILPASKQKKLVLLSMQKKEGSVAPSDSLSRVQDSAQMSGRTSMDKSSVGAKAKRRKGGNGAPNLDFQATRLLCSTTEAALSNMTDDDLRNHVAMLETQTQRASDLLEYWVQRKDSALGDKDAFEGVIENLVKHARRVRK